VAVPPLDGTLKKITEPDTDLLLQNKSEIDSFCRSFELKGNPLVRMSPLLLFVSNFNYDLNSIYLAVEKVEAFIGRKEIFFK